MNDLWIELFIFFLVVDRPESVMNLINSEDCEYEFEKIIKDAECIESEEFKNKILEYLNDKKNKILELNDIYKKHSIGWSVKEDEKMSTARFCEKQTHDIEKYIHDNPNLFNNENNNS